MTGRTASTTSAQQGLPRIDPSWLIAIFTCVAVLVFSTAPITAVTLGLALVFVGSFAKFDPLLWLIIFLLPVAPITEMAGLAVHDLASLAHLVLFAGVFTRKALDGDSISRWLWAGKVEKWGAGFCILAVISAVVVHPLEPGSARSLFRLASYVLFYYGVTGWVSSHAQLRKCMLWLFLSTIAVCVLAFHQLADNSLTDWFKWLYWNQMDAAPLWQGRPTSVFLGVNSLAAHVNMVIPFALGFQISRKFGSGLRLVARLCFCLSLVVLVLTLSRGAFIAFFFMMAIAFRTLLRDSGKRWKWIGAIALALAAGAAISYFAVQAADRSGGVSNAERLGGMDEVTMFRAVLYAAAWEMFLSSPVLGIGYGNFREHFAGSGTVNTDTVWDAHSLYFKYLAEIGLAGTVCFLGYIWIVVRGGLRSWREGKSDMERVIGAALVGSVATVMVQGLVESLIENPPFGSLLWLLFALWAVSSRIPPEENNSFLLRKTASHGA